MARRLPFVGVSKAKITSTYIIYIIYMHIHIYLDNIHMCISLYMQRSLERSLEIMIVSEERSWCKGNQDGRETYFPLHILCTF